MVIAQAGRQARLCWKRSNEGFHGRVRDTSTPAFDSGGIRGHPKFCIQYSLPHTLLLTATTRAGTLAEVIGMIMTRIIIHTVRNLQTKSTKYAPFITA